MEFKTSALNADEKPDQSKVISKLNLVTQSVLSSASRVEEPNSSKRNLRVRQFEIRTDQDPEYNPPVSQTQRAAAQSDMLPIDSDALLLTKKVGPLSRLTTNRLFSTAKARQVTSPLHIARTPDPLYTTRNFTSTSNHSQSEHSVKEFYLTSRSGPKNFSFKKLRPATMVTTELSHTQEYNSSEKITNLSQHRTQTGFATEPDLSEKVKLSNFYEGLQPSLRKFFADKKDFMKIFDDYNLANFCLDEVIMKVKCYRVELGLLLEKVADTHKKLFEKTIDASMKLFTHQELIIERKLVEIKDNLRKIELEKQDLELKNQHFKDLLSISETFSRMQAMNIENLQTEIKISHELRNSDLNMRLEQKLGDKTRENANIFGEPENNKAKKGYSERLQDDVANLQSFFEELDREHMNKARIIKDMSNHLKATLKKVKYDVSTQVDEGELNWTAQNLGTLNGSASKETDFLAMESTTVNVESKLKKKVSAAAENLSGVDPISVLKIKDKEIKADIEKDLADTKKKAANVITLNQAQNIIQEFENNWNIPLNLIIFLENVTKSGENARVLPWGYFRKIIFEIYNDRIKNRFEIENSLINTFIPLNEYTCMYFLKKFRVRRVAELKLLEFLVSLKYYVKIWPRAQLFANMCSITGVSKLREQQDAINMHEYDIYMQNFVLYAYDHIVADSTALVEHSEGTSWVIKQKLEEITENVLVFLTPHARKRFLTDLQMQHRFIGEGADKDAEGIDIDKLLFIYIEQYVEAKRKNIKALTKYFYKNSQEFERVVSIEDFASFLQEVNEVESSVANQAYPKDITTCRAFLFALTSGKNSYAISFKQCVAAMVRFGMDCPFPFISFGSDHQKQKEYLAAAASSDLFKKKNLQQQKRKGMVFPDKRKLGSFQKNEELVEEASSDRQTIGSLRQFDIKEQKSGQKSSIDLKYTNGVKMDSTSSLFAQHFSILRELKNYCKDFSELVESGDQEFEVMHKAFKQIARILDSGCEFLKFPVNTH